MLGSHRRAPVLHPAQARVTVPAHPAAPLAAAHLAVARLPAHRLTAPVRRARHQAARVAVASKCASGIKTRCDLFALSRIQAGDGKTIRAVSAEPPVQARVVPAGLFPTVLEVAAPVRPVRPVRPALRIHRVLRVLARPHHRQVRAVVRPRVVPVLAADSSAIGTVGLCLFAHLAIKVGATKMARRVLVPALAQT